MLLWSSRQNTSCRTAEAVSDWGRTVRPRQQHCRASCMGPEVTRRGRPTLSSLYVSQWSTKANTENPPSPPPPLPPSPPSPQYHHSHCHYRYGWRSHCDGQCFLLHVMLTHTQLAAGKAWWDRKWIPSSEPCGASSTSWTTKNVIGPRHQHRHAGNARTRSVACGFDFWWWW